MDLLGIPRSKISYLNRLQQDLTLAIQLDLTDDVERINHKILDYKEKQKVARTMRTKENSNGQD